METAKPAARSGWMRRIVRFLIARYYPRIEISDGARIPQTGPVLLCANHANSLIDPVLVGIAARRPVRFLAKAPLFDAPVLGPLMGALGMIPAFRGSDDSKQVRRNLESLDVGAQVLADGEAMGIFPEGKSHDEAHVEMVRSGAARIALQAAAKGATGAQVVPLGLNYQRKEDFRSAVWVCVGEPIDVDDLLSGHDGNQRKARRALTTQLEERLKQVVIHLDEPKWEPFLNDLEVLVPQRKIAGASKVRPIRQRKRIADAMNHFLSTDRPRTERIADSIAAYRDHVHASGLTVDSPLLGSRGLPMMLTLLWQAVWMTLQFVPAVAGSLFHIVPFTLVRAVSAKMRQAGRMTVSLWRFGLGLPVYAAWYVAAGWWLLYDFKATTLFAVTCLTAMPLLGVLALQFWRGARTARSLWWHQIRFSFRPSRLTQLREEQHELREKLAELAAEYEAVSPRPETPLPPSRLKAAGRVVTWAVALLALCTAAWFVAPWLFDKPLFDPEGGFNLDSLSAGQLQDQLESDEKTLQAVIRGLDGLESRAKQVQAEFAAGRRNYDNEADNDAVRQLLLSYINYRSALIRLVWKYQRHSQLKDTTDQLRAFLLDYTAASVLCESSLKFVREFNRSEETVDRLNEGEKVWNIPPGLYNTIEKNLSSRSTARLLASAGKYYDEVEDQLEANGLGRSSAHEPFHAAILRSEQTIARLGGSLWKQKVTVAAKDLGSLIKTVHYDTQSVISTWIGDVKIREPREGKTLITPDLVERLKQKLKPGDILIERRNWYMSNAFLPGYWPHAAIYVGTTEDLKELGLDQDPYVKLHWDEFSKPDHENHPLVIIEALSEGVVFASLEHSIGGGDSAAVLRPQLSQDEIKQAISLAFSHAGKPYDFEFDFDSHDKLVCTEVVYRAYGANLGPIDFPLKTILGRRTMPAIELVRKFQQEQGRDDAQLQLVAFIDGNEETGTSEYTEDAAAFIQTLDRPALTFLQGFEEAPVRKLGSLGGSLLLLMLVFTIGNLIYYGRKHPAH